MNTLPRIIVAFFATAILGTAGCVVVVVVMTVALRLLLLLLPLRPVALRDLALR